jgi:antitoxin HicB
MKAVNIESEIQRYIDRPYTRELIREDDGSWFARIVEFPGCMTVGETREEALAMLDDAMASWLEAKLEEHEAIPEPMTADEFSGRFVVRVTKTLHRDLVRAAERNSVSLNQFVVTVLAKGVGYEAGTVRQSSPAAGTSTADITKHGRTFSAAVRLKADTKVATLREAYGDDVPQSVRGDVTLGSYLRRKKAPQRRRP